MSEGESGHNTGTPQGAPKEGPHSGGVSRRGLLARVGAAALIGAGTGLGAGEVLAPRADTAADTAAAPRLRMSGAHAPASGPGRLQPGITGTPPAFAHVLALDLADSPGGGGEGGGSAAESRERAAEVLRAWTAAADRLREEGPAAVLPGAPSAGLLPASLGVTAGLGGSLLAAAGLQDARPEAMADLPSFSTDALQQEWCGGDLLLQVGAEDPVVAAAAVQHLLGRAGARVRVRWAVRGFRRTAAAAEDPGATPRNLMGQIDGTNNPARESSLLQRTVQVGRAAGPAWMAGGSYVVVRRIRMLLDDWFGEDSGHRERVIGRDLPTGAPLGQQGAGAEVDLTARDAEGRPRIPEHAHIRLASPQNNLGARMLRRGYSFDEGWRGDGTRDAGLLFMAWQADPARGFVAVQQNLAEAGDALNEYTRHEGSALFAVPPAARNGGYIGQDLLES
ncbi:Dyp-type peroxidase [Streptomonospora wellingtoniae]|uniref:Dyp-type peroxidase n=1 Tax=Streptomonospora wellingtoniae TaxID=3075544 RepID=A0ABU2KTJ0_9ACTN|nr:Dyp-type peroxidase [Streptomonospora sp. DSM 45055]MDT0302605.1 Dyp-type peroxidase [Streptomonospora sp. DSM 45055]